MSSTQRLEMPPSDHVLFRGEVFAFDIQQVRTHIRWKYIEFVVSNHSSLKNCAELQFACLWVYGIHKYAYMMHTCSLWFLRPKKGGTWGNTTWQYDNTNYNHHQGSPGIIHPNCHFFQASPITSRMGPEGPQQNPDLQRSVATFLQLLQDGAPSPHMSPGTASGTKRWPVGFSMGSPGIMDYHGISWSPCIEMWLSIMVYHYL